jgi:hypothetical protein
MEGIHFSKDSLLQKYWLKLEVKDPYTTYTAHKHNQE